MKRFWNWRTHRVRDQETGNEMEERVLMLNGTIAEDSWFDDEITPAMFRKELFAGNGPVTVFINSPGGDCIAASQIYTMLMEYKGAITVKIDGIAASAASVIAMAGTEVLMAPTSLIMIHNPATVAFGDREDLKKATRMLDEVKESIINAYEIKTGLDRAKLARFMDEETWMNAGKAIELGFADGLLEDLKQRKETDPEPEKDESTGTENSNVRKPVQAYAFSRKCMQAVLLNKISAKSHAGEKLQGQVRQDEPDGFADPGDGDRKHSQETGNPEAATGGAGAAAADPANCGAGAAGAGNDGSGAADADKQGSEKMDEKDDTEDAEDTDAEKAGRSVDVLKSRLLLMKEFM